MFTFGAGAAHQLSILYSVNAALDSLQIDSFLRHSSHPVLCSTVPGRVSSLPGLTEEVPLVPVLFSTQVRFLRGGVSIIPNRFL